MFYKYLYILIISYETVYMYYLFLGDMNERYILPKFDHNCYLLFIYSKHYGYMFKYILAVIISETMGMYDMIREKLL